jgi:hypothetical protein
MEILETTRVFSEQSLDLLAHQKILCLQGNWSPSEGALRQGESLALDGYGMSSDMLSHNELAHYRERQAMMRIVWLKEAWWEPMRPAGSAVRPVKTEQTSLFRWWK